MKNLKGLAVFLLILVILFSIVLYFYNQSRKQDLMRSISCQRDGRILFEQDKVALNDSQTINSAPHFKFSKRLNTCIYGGAWYEDTPASHISYYFIRNVYTNEEIAVRHEYTLNGSNELKFIGDPVPYNDLYNEFFVKE